MVVVMVVVAVVELGRGAVRSASAQAFAREHIHTGASDLVPRLEPTAY